MIEISNDNWIKIGIIKRLSRKCTNMWKTKHLKYYGIHLTQYLEEICSANVYKLRRKAAIP